jgi:mannosyltransferase OCH1-like enzyme
MEQIPKIIHQIWIQGHSKMPRRYLQQALTWQRQNPSWEYHLWDEDSLKALIRQRYAELLPVYEAYEEVAARADIGRYAVLHAFGGLYVDTDTICVRPITPYFLEPNISLYVQVYDNPACPAHPGALIEGVSNAMIACSPGHTFWQYVFKFLRDSEHPQFYWILVTGPDMFVGRLKEYLSGHNDVYFFTRDRIITAFYLSRHYLRWYAWKNHRVFAIHYNDSGRLGWKPSFRSWLWPNV